MSHAPDEALGAANAEYVDFLYEAYLTDPGSVSPEWRATFARLAGAGDGLSPLPRTGHAGRAVKNNEEKKKE